MSNNTTLQHFVAQKRSRKSWIYLGTILLILVMIGCFYMKPSFSINPSNLSEVKINSPNSPEATIFTSRVFPNLNFSEVSVRPAYLVDTEYCKILNYDPFDERILKIENTLKPNECLPLPLLVESNRTSLWINKSAFSYYKIENESKVCCCYRNLPRFPTPGGLGSIAKRKCHGLNIPINITETEYVLVSCRMFGTITYENYFGFVPLKNTSESTMKKSSSNSEKQYDEGVEKLNVLIIGIEAISRLSFHRQMPETVKFLKQSLNAIEMVGFNKVTTNRFSTIVTLMTGKTERELFETCWQNETTKLDNCFWLWKTYNNKNYKTILGQDASIIGGYDYKKVDCLKNQTDYYFRPYWIEEEEIYNKFIGNTELCVTSRSSIRKVIDYITKLTQTFSSEPYFATFWTNGSTPGIMNFPQLMDEDYVSLLRNLLYQDIFKNTVLIFMSDREGNLSRPMDTHGRYPENRHPFLFLIFPNWFTNLYSSAVANVRENSHKLISIFDVHETLKDILNLHRIQNNSLANRSKYIRNTARGISLFLPIKSKRTCADAGIDAKFCACRTL